MNLQDSINRARKMSHEQSTDMVVGKDDAGVWVILPIDNSESDMLTSSVIVNSRGLKYPEDHERLTGLIANQ